MANTAKAWKSRSNHFGCRILNRLKTIAATAKRIDNANKVPIRSFIPGSPPGATVIANEMAEATANKQHKYQDTLMTVMAIAAGCQSKQIGRRHDPTNAFLLSSMNRTWCGIWPVIR